MLKPQPAHVGTYLLAVGFTLGGVLPIVSLSPAYAQVSRLQPLVLAQRMPVRPPTQQVTVEIEGEPQTFEFTLFYQKRFPISTYYPATRMAQRAQCRQEGCVLEFAALTPEGQANPDAVLLSFFFPQSSQARGQSLAEIQEKFLTGPGGLLSRNPDWEVLSTYDGSFANPWIRRSLMFRTPSQVGVIHIAQHQDRFFLVMERYQGDYGDGYAPLINQIYQKLRFEADHLDINPSSLLPIQP